MLIVSSADGKTMSVTKAPFKLLFIFSRERGGQKKFSEIRAFLHFSLKKFKKLISYF